MTRTIQIDPVTRIEGHAKVILDLNAHGIIENAGMVVNELRGFERILVGMEADRMPLTTARICGVCPTSHHLAAAKALDHAAGVEPPPAAKLLRELMFMGHFIHSHALSLFVLQGPDLVMGLDAPAAQRNVVGVVQAVPEIAKKALRLRSIGQKINEIVGGRGVHPVSAVAGGICFEANTSQKQKLKSLADEAIELVKELAAVAKSLLLKQVDQHPALLENWVLPTWYLGTVKNDKLNLYDGSVRVVDNEGTFQKEFSSAQYHDFLVESTLDWSYMKPVAFAAGETHHTYRVGPLARINCVQGMETPLADAEFWELKKVFGISGATVLYTYARVIELIYACEKASAIVDSKEIDGEKRIPVKFTGGRGVAHVEAPRGTLIHDYEIDENGIVRDANLIVATQQNYSGINESITQAARSHVENKGDDALLNAIEFAIRCYDPCLSCATHAVGQMPLAIEVRQNGAVVRTLGRQQK